VILAGGSTEYLGKASARQHVARISIDVHIWAIEDGADTAKAIGFVVTQALLSMADQQTGFEIDSFVHCTSSCFAKDRADGGKRIAARSTSAFSE
jgi:hypothetical protein